MSLHLGHRREATGGRSRVSFRWALVIAIALVVLLAVIFAIYYSLRDTGTGSNTSLQDVVTQPSNYYGKEVAVTGDVSRVFAPQLFEMEGMLVVVPRGGTYQPHMGDTLNAGGRIESFSQASASQQVPGVDWSSSQLSAFHDRPVMLASSLQTKAP